MKTALAIAAVLLTLAFLVWVVPEPPSRLYDRLQSGELVRCDPPANVPDIFKGQQWFCRAGEGQ